MRTTKFRGKRLDNGEWAIGLLIKMRGAWHILDWDDENTAYPVDPATIGQYTGLKDKNGQEVYEGDIVEKYGDLYVCRWIDAHACFAFVENVKYGVHHYFQKIDEKRLTLISNIHDNPELLKGGEQ